MLEGEFNSMTALYNTSPDFIPRPINWGKLSATDPEVYFFLCQFIEMTNHNPDPAQLCKKLVQLHQNSVSPTGMFGFHINTSQGPLPQQTAWNPSWSAFYIQLIKGAMKLNRERNGKWKNLEECIDRLITHVVPLVLGPLEADGRKVKPCLIHGDLWDGNIGTDFETGEIYIFDASSYFAHNEMEIAMWRGRFNQVVSAKAYMNAYLSRMGISEPTEQFNDRHRIYSIYMLLHESACHYGADFRDESVSSCEIVHWLTFKDATRICSFSSTNMPHGRTRR
jgi:fructosamine-3-kinase